MTDAVTTAFASALTRTRGGLSFAAIRDGRVIYDLRGGWADRAHARVWDDDTAPTIFSGSKGLVAMCLAILFDRGALELDAPVARYWPEFANAGKSRTTVRKLASHRAGLPAVEREQGLDLLRSPRRAASLLAEQAPSPELAGVPCYHAVTFGWLCGELVRRVDGDPLAVFFAREVAKPAGAEVWFGIPDAELPRAAEMFVADDWVEPGPAVDSDYARRIFGVAPGLWSGPELLFNLPRVRLSEIPGIGAIGTSLAVARCHQASAAGAGGSAHGYWPSQRVAFSFGLNELHSESEDTRCRDVLAALHSELAA